MTTFLHGTENIYFQKLFSRSKNRNKNPGHFFLDFILFFNIAVEKFRKIKKFGQVFHL